MSPEVATHQPYNQGCDVFSFGVVLYEILSLNRLKLRNSGKMIDTSKIKVSKYCPDPVRQMMMQSLSYATSDRPSMEDIASILNHTISNLQDIYLYSRAERYTKRN
jgi:hypothetical protein